MVWSGDTSGSEHSREFDPIDRRLLELLATDARLSARRLGREVGMSPGAISDRVARLERENVIRGYHADVNPTALGFGMEVIVGLQTEQGPSINETLAYLESVPEVQQVYVVSGQWDLVVHVRVRDQEHLRQTILGSVWNVPAFRHSETLLVLDSREGSVTWFTDSPAINSNAESATVQDTTPPEQGRSPARRPTKSAKKLTQSPTSKGRTQKSR
jgi:DNA-binding Lrp family transcriptional regulator